MPLVTGWLTSTNSFRTMPAKGVNTRTVAASSHTSRPVKRHERRLLATDRLDGQRRQLRGVGGHDHGIPADFGLGKLCGLLSGLQPDRASTAQAARRSVAG